MLRSCYACGDMKSPTLNVPVSSPANVIVWPAVWSGTVTAAVTVAVVATATGPILNVPVNPPANLTVVTVY